jgi:hypothetical protein
MMKPVPVKPAIPVTSGGQKVYSSDLQLTQPIKKKKIYTIRGKKWYSKLIPSNSQYYHGLLDDYRKEDLMGHLVILYTRKWENDLDYLYCYFDSYVEFYEYYRYFPVEDRSFYEIINFYQKPHFDIDFKIKTLKSSYLFDRNPTYDDCKKIADHFISTIIKSCQITMLPNILSLEEDVLIYTSHGNSNGEEKLSYHIVLDHWSHFDNIEAKAFYDKVSRLTQCFLNGKYVEFLDEKVYSENQAFRLVGSHKFNDVRCKKLESEFYYFDQLIVHKFDKWQENLVEMNKFSKSLITFTSGCKLLQSFKVDKIYKVVYEYDLGAEDVKEITGLLHAKFKDQFQIREVKKNKINLLKRGPYYCSLCQRVHPHENPRIVVYYGIIYWQCRRTFEKLILGHLSSYKKEKDEIVDEEDDFTGNFLSFGDFKIDLTVENDEGYIFENEEENIYSENMTNVILKNGNEKNIKVKNDIFQKDHNENYDKDVLNDKINVKSDVVNKNTKENVMEKDNSENKDKIVLNDKINTKSDVVNKKEEFEFTKKTVNVKYINAIYNIPNKNINKPENIKEIEKAKEEVKTDVVNTLSSIKKTRPLSCRKIQKPIHRPNISSVMTEIKW